MDEPAWPAPRLVTPLLDQLFHHVEEHTGWQLTRARSATLEIVRDGSGYTLYAKGRYTGHDLDQPSSPQK
jgi:hypothetical protein